jgi:hypothetical protein
MLFRNRATATRYFETPSASAPGGLLGRVKRWVKLSLVGAGGILSALIMDLQNRGDSSALFVIARSLVYLAALIGIAAVPLYWTVGILMAAGAAVVLYFNPQGLRAAYAQGFGALAAVMTLVPQDGGLAIGAPSGPAQAEVPAPVIEEGDADLVSLEPPLVLASFALAQDEAAKEPERTEGYDIAVRIAFPGGIPEPIALKIRQGRLKARLFDPGTNKAYNLFLSTGSPIVREGERLLIETVIPSELPESTLLLRIESEGYEIAVSEFTAEQGENPVWDLAMTPTDEPLLWQRLKHTYAF